MLVAPLDDLPKDGLVDLDGRVSDLRYKSAHTIVLLTFGTGMGSWVAASPRSSSKFLIRTERMAALRSIYS